MDAAEFMRGLRDEFPPLREDLDQEGWAGYLYLETGSFARYAQRAIDGHDDALVRRCFDFADRAWRDGDDQVQNADRPLISGTPEPAGRQGLARLGLGAADSSAAGPCSKSRCGAGLPSNLTVHRARSALDRPEQNPHSVMDGPTGGHSPLAEWGR